MVLVPVLVVVRVGDPVHTASVFLVFLVREAPVVVPSLVLGQKAQELHAPKKLECLPKTRSGTPPIGRFFVARCVWKSARSVVSTSPFLVSLARSP